MPGLPDRPSFGKQPPSGGPSEPGIGGSAPVPSSPPTDGTIPTQPEPNLTGLARDRARAAQVSPFSNDEPTQTPTPFATGQAKREPPKTENAPDIQPPSEVDSPTSADLVVRRSAADDNVTSEPAATQERTVVVAARRDRPTTRGRITNTDNTEEGHPSDIKVDITSHRRIITNIALLEKKMVRAAEAAVKNLADWRQNKTNPQEQNYEDQKTGWKFVATTAKSSEAAETAVTFARRVQSLIDSQLTGIPRDEPQSILAGTHFNAIEVAPVLAVHHNITTNHAVLVHQDSGGRRIDIKNPVERNAVYQVIDAAEERLEQVGLGARLSPANFRIIDDPRTNTPTLIFMDFGQIRSIEEPAKKAIKPPPLPRPTKSTVRETTPPHPTLEIHTSESHQVISNAMHPNRPIVKYAERTVAEGRPDSWTPSEIDPGSYLDSATEPQLLARTSTTELAQKALAQARLLDRALKRAEAQNAVIYDGFESIDAASAIVAHTHVPSDKTDLVHEFKDGRMVDLDNPEEVSRIQRVSTNLQPVLVRAGVPIRLSPANFLIEETDVGEQILHLVDSGHRIRTEGERVALEGTPTVTRRTIEQQNREATETGEQPVTRRRAPTSRTPSTRQEGRGRPKGYPEIYERLERNESTTQIMRETGVDPKVIYRIRNSLVTQRHARLTAADFAPEEGKSLRTPAQIADLGRALKRDSKNMSLQELADKWDISVQYASHLLKRVGVSKGHTHLTEGQKAELIGDKQAGMSVKDLMEKYGRSRAAVGAILREAGLTRKYGITTEVLRDFIPDPDQPQEVRSFYDAYDLAKARAAAQGEQLTIAQFTRAADYLRQTHAQIPKARAERGRRRSADDIDS